MTQIERIISGLNTCRGLCSADCPYYGKDESTCRSELLQDAEEMLKKVVDNIQNGTIKEGGYSGHRLKLARELVGVSQKKLAELTGISYSSICKYETGDRKIDDAAAVKLADALGINVSRITNLGGEEDNLKYAVPVPTNTIEVYDDEPITVAHKLATAVKPYDRGKANVLFDPEHKEEILTAAYSPADLRELAGYLMIYCDARERERQEF